MAKMEKPFVAYGLIGIIALSLVVYAYLVNAAIFSTTIARDTREHIADTMSIISELENRYASNVTAIDTDGALAVGFSKGLSPRFLSQSSGLSFNSLSVR